MAQENRHLTTEQLSDFLSGEVSVQEQAQWESHLQNCSPCQQELASLRQVVAMLHTLPAPALPRSFVLPLETVKAVKTAEPVALPLAAAPTPIGTMRRSTWKPYMRVVMRTVSSIAAVIGVVFLLSALFAGVGGGNMSMATSGTSGAVTTSAPRLDTVDPHASTSSDGKTVTNQAKGTPTFASGRATPTLPAVVSPQPPQSVEAPVNNQQNTSSSSWFTIFTQSAPTARLGVGMLLIIFGIMGFVLFKRQAHH